MRDIPTRALLILQPWALTIPSLSRDGARSRAEGCRSAAESFRVKATDMRRLAAQLADPEQQRVASSFAIIAERQVTACLADAEAYERVARGGEP